MRVRLRDQRRTLGLFFAKPRVFYIGPLTSSETNWSPKSPFFYFELFRFFRLFRLSRLSTVMKTTAEAEPRQSPVRVETYVKAIR